MGDHHNTIRSGKIFALMKWVWRNNYRGPLIGSISFLIAIVAVSVGILAINLSNNADLRIVLYIAKAVVILCCMLVGCALLLGVFGFILTAFFVGKQIFGAVGLFTSTENTDFKENS